MLLGSEVNVQLTVGPGALMVMGMVLWQLDLMKSSRELSPNPEMSFTVKLTDVLQEEREQSTRAWEDASALLFDVLPV